MVDQGVAGVIGGETAPPRSLFRIRHCNPQAIEDGQPVLAALGVALPALQIPRDTVFFRTLNDKTAGHLSKWKTLYTQAIKKRSCYLLKQTPTQNLLLEEELQKSFDQVRDAIPNDLHRIVEEYIHADSGWNTHALALAECEWEAIKPLFDGLKREAFNLGKATLDFYDEREAELLTNDERDYLARLRDIKRTDAQEEDEEFYKRHRNELKELPALKGRWDRFILGTPVETDDFLLGITLCLKWLFDQNLSSSKRKLKISSDRRTKRDLRDINYDAGIFFATRYRGLKDLFGRGVSWEFGELMNFEAISDQWKKASKPYVNDSGARAALQLKFVLELEVELTTGSSQKFSKQLVWTFDPNTVASEFPGDWSRLVEHPLVWCSVSREPISVKGRFQSLDLHNVKTLYAAFGKDRGSFVAIYKKDQDIAAAWPKALTQAREQGWISDTASTKLLGLFNAFVKSYSAAITGFATEGLACKSLVTQAEDFGTLIETLCRDAKGDRNRINLLQPLLALGTVEVEGGKVTAIVAPWQPLRLAAMANKATQVAALIRHLLTADEVLFGDPPLFFKELQQELAHPYYPELVLGWNDTKPELLVSHRSPSRLQPSRIARRQQRRQ